MKNEFQYEKFESTILWGVVNDTIEDLVENNDIEEKTDRKNIVGYLCKILLESGTVKIENLG